MTNNNTTIIEDQLDTGETVKFNYAMNGRLVTIRITPKSMNSSVVHADNDSSYYQAYPHYADLYHNTLKEKKNAHRNSSWSCANWCCS